MFAQPGKLLNPPPPVADVLRRTVAIPWHNGDNKRYQPRQWSSCSTQWETFFAYFLSFNKKQVAGRGESRRFFLAEMERNRIVVRYNSMLCGRIESL